MCRVLRVHRSGFYAWLHIPESNRAKENNRLLTMIRESFQENGGVYGSPRIHRDLREMGISCGRNRVARIMRKHKIRALIGYKKPKFKSGKLSVVSPNRLKQNFNAMTADQVWSTDITYIRTYEGWLYLAVVMDHYSRMVVGWSMKTRLKRDLVLDALLMAIWRRKPKNEVIVHSDQGSQYGSDDWICFCRDHNINTSMSRRGNCYDNAAIESFFGSLKKERIKRKIYPTREMARADIFDYIEIFYNRKRRHSHVGNVRPIEFEMVKSGS